VIRWVKYRLCRHPHCDKEARLKEVVDWNQHHARGQSGTVATLEPFLASPLPRAPITFEDRFQSGGIAYPSIWKRISTAADRVIFGNRTARPKISNTAPNYPWALVLLAIESPKTTYVRDDCLLVPLEGGPKFFLVVCCRVCVAPVLHGGGTTFSHFCAIPSAIPPKREVSQYV
jgi:hypothetical protein